jgi:dihydropyrimidine dehydrogenase (NAD+) subunit PreT
MTMTEAPQGRLESRLPESKPQYSPGEAHAEAERCLFCTDAPCVTACPTEIDIPGFIRQIATGDTLGAARTIFTQNILGYSCARVCPVEVLCVGACVYNPWHKPPIQIGRLQRFATEATLDAEARGGPKALRPKGMVATARKVALLGAGPASLACAAYLALEGHRPVIFEKRTLPGGLNTTGIAPYKIHTEDALREVDYVRSLGVEIRCGVEAGVDVSVASLRDDYDAVFLGLGLGADTRLGVPGEDGPGVWGATAFIEAMKNTAGFALPTERKALVVGGGNTAIDVARELSQLGVGEVAMVYRRGVADMSGYTHEMDLARREGVLLHTHCTPVAVLRDAAGAVTGLRVRRADGREDDLTADLIVLAIGQQKLRALAAEFEGVSLDRRGCVEVDAATRRTGNAKVYAGGDCINGGKEVVNAVADGREAARAMLRAWSNEGTTHG